MSNIIFEPKLCMHCQTPIICGDMERKFCKSECRLYFFGIYDKNNKICECGTQTKNYNKFCDLCILKGKDRIPRKSFNEIMSEATRRRWMLSNCPHKCEICGIEEWQGQPTPLIVDHIDGHSENNDRSNLRLVCPNCDAQLPTYKAKNKGNGRASRRERYKDGKSF